MYKKYLYIIPTYVLIHILNYLFTQIIYLGRKVLKKLTIQITTKSIFVNHVVNLLKYIKNCLFNLSLGQSECLGDV